MSQARTFIERVGTDSNVVYAALTHACEGFKNPWLPTDVEVVEDQNWDVGKSTWTFPDGSQVWMCEGDVQVQD